MSTSYLWTRTLSIVYIFTIYLSVSRPINHDYSRLLFDHIAYSANNAGRSCVVIVYRHKDKCNTLIIIILLFCLSRRVTLHRHIVYCLHIINKFFVLTSDKPRLFRVVVLFHHILFQKFGQTLRLRHQLTQR